MKTWVIVVVVVVLAGAGFYVYRHSNTPISGVPTTSVPITTPDSSASTTPEAGDFVQLVSVKSNSVITSPLTITGEARGNWYFEASFPIKIRDEFGVVLATVPAQAQGSWMTTNYVPFKATINFTAPTTTRGYIELQKDNPSGDPKRDQSVIIPIRFR